MDARTRLPVKFTWYESGKPDIASLQGRGSPALVELHFPTHRNPTPPVDCPCSRLITPLDDGEELPDHACEPTRRETVFDWASRRLELLVPALKHGFPMHYFSKEMHLAILAPAHEREPPEQWPLPVEDGHVGLVIQQWVEEGPNRTLAGQLAKDHVWQGRLKRFREYVLEPILRDGGWDGADLSKTGFVITNRPVWVRGTIAMLLRGVRLPHSPATVEHFFAALAHRQEPLPARGLLVTTVVYVQPKGQGQVGYVVDPIPRIEITGDGEFATQGLFEKVQQVAHRHREWVHNTLRGSEGHRLSDIRAKRRAQPGAFQRREDGAPRAHNDPWYDYAADALAEKKVEELVERCREYKGLHPDDWDQPITAHLDKTYRRVRKRRLANGLSAEPSNKNWREDARSRLRAILAQHLG